MSEEQPPGQVAGRPEDPAGGAEADAPAWWSQPPAHPGNSTAPGVAERPQQPAQPSPQHYGQPYPG
ncbi:MAG TPA: hypothetical protein VFM09_08800, partial [Marmoricola sp.]|nr:hypothetical protein [Marmoricola sp.]